MQKALHPRDDINSMCQEEEEEEEEVEISSENSVDGSIRAL